MLEKEGAIFRTKSDTEVIAQLYIRHGLKFLDFMEGMWAIAILDTKNDFLLLARDRFGEKPVYFYTNKNGIYFGSQIKFLCSLSNTKLEINIPKVIQGLRNGYKQRYKTNENFFIERFE